MGRNAYNKNCNADVQPCNRHSKTDRQWGQGSLVGSIWEDYLEETTFELLLKALF